MLAWLFRRFACCTRHRQKLALYSTLCGRVFGRRVVRLGASDAAVIRFARALAVRLDGSIGLFDSNKARVRCRFFHWTIVIMQRAQLSARRPSSPFSSCIISGSIAMLALGATAHAVDLTVSAIEVNQTINTGSLAL